MKRLIIVIGAGAVIALQGCTLNTQPESGTDGIIQQRVINPDQGVGMTQAALAVAMAEELGKLDPLNQVHVVNNKVALQPGVCIDGCPKTRALLDLQGQEINFGSNGEVYIDQLDFNATTYQSELVAGLNRQWVREIEDPHGSAPADHVLQFLYTVPMGGLAVHSVFHVWEPGCDFGDSSGEVSVSLQNPSASANQESFSIRVVANNGSVDLSTVPLRFEAGQSGLVMEFDYSYKDNPYSSMATPTATTEGNLIDIHLSGTLVSGQAAVANVRVHAADWSNIVTSPSFASQSIEVAESEGCVTYEGNLEDFETRLWMFGYPNNPFLDLRIGQDGTIAIDPDLGDTGDDSTSSGSCMESTVGRLYDPEWDYLGCCCVVGDVYGIWAVHPLNYQYLYCDRY